MPVNRKKHNDAAIVKDAAKEPDTAPDEFIGPKADTDVPIDGQIRNDAVLRGEDHADERIPDDDVADEE